MTDQLRCPECGRTKPLAEFAPAPSRSSGVASYCRPCAKQRARDWRATARGRAASRKAANDYYRRRTRGAATCPEHPGEVSPG